MHAKNFKKNIYLKGRVTGKEGEIDRTSIHWFKWLQWRELGQEPETPFQYLSGWQGPEYFGHPPLLSQAGSWVRSWIQATGTQCWLLPVSQAAACLGTLQCQPLLRFLTETFFSVEVICKLSHGEKQDLGETSKAYCTCLPVVCRVGDTWGVPVGKGLESWWNI